MRSGLRGPWDRRRIGKGEDGLFPEHVGGVGVKSVGYAEVGTAVDEDAGWKWVWASSNRRGGGNEEGVEICGFVGRFAVNRVGSSLGIDAGG